jgi:hypothetical protein
MKLPHDPTVVNCGGEPARVRARTRGAWRPTRDGAGRGAHWAGWWERHVVSYDRALDGDYRCWCFVCASPCRCGQKDPALLALRSGLLEVPRAELLAAGADPDDPPRTEDPPGDGVDGEGAGEYVEVEGGQVGRLSVEDEFGCLRPDPAEPRHVTLEHPFLNASWAAAARRAWDVSRPSVLGGQNASVADEQWRALRTATAAAAGLAPGGAAPEPLEPSESESLSFGLDSTGEDATEGGSADGAGRASGAKKGGSAEDESEDGGVEDLFDYQWSGRWLDDLLEAHPTGRVANLSYGAARLRLLSIIINATRSPEWLDSAAPQPPPHTLLASHSVPPVRPPDQRPSPPPPHLPFLLRVPYRCTFLSRALARPPPINPIPVRIPIMCRSAVRDRLVPPALS